MKRRFPKKKEIRNIRKWGQYIKRASRGGNITYLRIFEHMKKLPLYKSVSEVEKLVKARGKQAEHLSRAKRIVSKIVVDTAISNFGLRKVLSARDLEHLRKISIEFVVQVFQMSKIKSEERKDNFAERIAEPFGKVTIEILGKKRGSRYYQEIKNLLNIISEILWQ